MFYSNMSICIMYVLFPGGRQDVDLRQLGLPFKAMQNYTPATEIDASIASHSPISYKVNPYILLLIVNCYVKSFDLE